MDASFHRTNRKNLFAQLPEGAVALLFSGHAPHLSADAYYPFFANRNYLYLAGVDFEGLVLLLHKCKGEEKETLYILPKDPMKERWVGRRYTDEEAKALSGIADVRYVETFWEDLYKLVAAGGAQSLWLDLFKFCPELPDDEAYETSAKMAKLYPWLKQENLQPKLRAQRTLKAPCEIEAMKKAMLLTKAGILAMMQASRPGMYEYEYKAEFDHVLTKNGVLQSAFPSIISAGQNNFCIHYYGYGGKVQDGDMILNDVGAQWDNEANDVSRGWPCNGKFSKEQTALYSIAYSASQHMFATIRPGMPMPEVDATVKRFCGEELQKLGLLKPGEDAGKYIWHGGAHHVGYDVHDAVTLGIGPIQPGMVFCVDVGIYCEEWGIGFRLEDNCLITENGCQNLSADIPRSIEDIEAAMAAR